MEESQEKEIYCYIQFNVYGGNDAVALRSRKEGALGEVNGDAVVEKLSEEVKERRL